MNVIHTRSTGDGGFQLTPAGRELLEFTMRVPGYYDRDELEYFLRVLDRLPNEASTLEIGVEYGRSASLILQVAKSPDRTWFMEFIDARLGDHAPAARAMFQRVLDNLGYVSQPSHGTPTLSFEVPRGSEGVLFEMTSEAVFPVGSSALNPDPFDFIHIDAAHDAANVMIDLRWAEAYLKLGGDLLLHDYDRRNHDGDQVFPGYTNTINAWMANHSFDRVALAGTLIHFRRTA